MPPDLINSSVESFLSGQEQDNTPLKNAAGDIETSYDVDNSVLAGIPEGCDRLWSPPPTRV